MASSSPPSIDLVYCWVDGDHPQHQYLRATHRPPNWASNHISRFRSSGEIYASIHSAKLFSPWLRRIWVIVDDCQVNRFTPTSGVTVVPHSAIFTGNHATHLPTFNSQAIETHLHNIPGLAELFLYANDDTFFGAPCHWSQFFSAAGYPHLYTTNERLRSEVTRGMAVHFYARVNNGLVLNALQGGRASIRYSVHHQVRPLCKQLFREAWSQPLVKSRFELTSAAKFRSNTDIEPVGLLLHWGHQQGKVMQLAAGLRTRYVGVTNKTDLVALSQELKVGGYHLYCLNDVMYGGGGGMVISFRYFLERMLPSSGVSVSVPVENVSEMKESREGIATMPMVPTPAPTISSHPSLPKRKVYSDAYARTIKASQARAAARRAMEAKLRTVVTVMAPVRRVAKVARPVTKVTRVRKGKIAPRVTPKTASKVTSRALPRPLPKSLPKATPQPRIKLSITLTQIRHLLSRLRS